MVRAPVWIGHVEYDWRTTVWREVLDALAGAHELVRYDARGMGLSDRGIELSFEAGVSDLESVVDALELKRFALLGMSPLVAYAARHPERVTRLVLAGGYAQGSLVARPERAAAVEHGHPRCRAMGQRQSGFSATLHFARLSRCKRCRVTNSSELQRISASGDMAARILRMLARVDVSAQLALVRAPTLVLHSRDDAWIPA